MLQVISQHMNWVFGDIKFVLHSHWDDFTEIYPLFLAIYRTIAVTLISEPFQVETHITIAETWSDCAFFCLVSKFVKFCCSLSKHWDVVVCL